MRATFAEVLTVTASPWRRCSRRRRSSAPLPPRERREHGARHREARAPARGAERARQGRPQGRPGGLEARALPGPARPASRRRAAHGGKRKRLFERDPPIAEAGAQGGFPRDTGALTTAVHAWEPGEDLRASAVAALAGTPAWHHLGAPVREPAPEPKRAPIQRRSGRGSGVAGEVATRRRPPALVSAGEGCRPGAKPAAPDDDKRLFRIDGHDGSGAVLRRLHTNAVRIAEPYLGRTRCSPPFLAASAPLSEVGRTRRLGEPGVAAGERRVRRAEPELVAVREGERAEGPTPLVEGRTSSAPLHL